MKNLLILTAALQGLASVAHGHDGCQIIPPHILQRFIDDPNLDPVLRQNANSTLQLSEANRQRRMGLDGEGIIADGDDEDFPAFQDPADEQSLQEEEDNLEAADQEEPDPDSTEDDSGDANSRRRRRFRARQGAAPDRYIYNKKMSCSYVLPGTLVRTESSAAATDDDINLVFDGLGTVYKMYSDIFGRDSWDNQGGKLHGQVHFCNAAYNNAEWDGRQMLFGDGDGVLYTLGGFVRSTDVIGHEVTHGVVQKANPLAYADQSGALNEHLADVFGSLTRQYLDGTDAASSDWLIGIGILTAKVVGPGGSGALRDVCNPGTAFQQDPQTAHMNDYDSTSVTALKDHGGVHINSGIPNKAFCLFAKDIGGNAWETPGKIWYDVLTQGQGRFNYRRETFATFAQKTIDSATAQFEQATVDSLTSAWQQVGVM